MIRLLKKRPGRALWVPVLLAAVLVLLLPDPAAAQNQQVGSVSVLEGRASVIRAGTSRTEALQVGSSLYQNDTIKTEAGGKLRVLFMDQSVISVASNTSLTITEYVFNPQEQVRSGGVKLLWGKVKCFVNDFLGYKSKKFNVQTDTAVIGVRGTVFLVWKVNDEITRAAAFQNEVTVANVARPDEYVILGPGMMSQVVGRARPTYPSKVDPKIYQLLHEGFLACGHGHDYTHEYRDDRQHGQHGPTRRDYGQHDPARRHSGNSPWRNGRHRGRDHHHHHHVPAHRHGNHHHLDTTAALDHHQHHLARGRAYGDAGFSASPDRTLRRAMLP